MVNIASEDFPKIKVCDDETGLPKPSYTFFSLSFILEINFQILISF